MTVSNEWKAYERDMIPAVPQPQHEEIMQAFFAGALACFHLMIAACSIKDGDVRERELDAIQEDILAVTGVEGDEHAS